MNIVSLIISLVSGAIGFLAMIGACFVFARRFARLGQGPWALYSAATGVVFFAAFAGIASGSSQPPIVLSFVSAVVLFTLFCALGLILTFVGIFFRGPGYSFVIPYLPFFENTSPGLHFSL